MDKRTPEVAFKALFSGSREGATVLRSTMRSLKPVERRLVASTVLRNLGKAKPFDQDDVGQVFSPETYLARWNQFSPEARAALFEGLDPTFTKNLNALAKAMHLQTESHRILANPAGTAVNTAAWSIMTGLGALGTGLIAGSPKAGLVAAGATVGAAIGGNLAARVFTNPRSFIGWCGKPRCRPARSRRSSPFSPSRRRGGHRRIGISPRR